MSAEPAAAFAHWGVVAERRLSGGHRNAVYLVRQGDTRLVAKTTGHSDAGLRWMAPVRRMAHVAGLFVPAMLADPAGRLSVGGLTLEPFVEGVPPCPRDMRRLVHRVKLFHGLTRGWHQRPGAVSSRELVRFGAPTSIGDAAMTALSQLPPVPDVIVHGDLQPGNVLLAASGPVLIDWDEARRDHPALDLPVTNVPPAIWRARSAWEAVSGWRVEPAYARRQAAALRRPQRRQPPAL